MELGVGIGHLSFLAWMPVPELAPEHGRGSKMAARRRKGATVERRQKAAAWRCSEGVRGGGSPCAGVWGGLGSCVEGQIRGGGGGGGGGGQLCCPRCEGGLKHGRQGGGHSCRMSRRSPPSRWTTTCGITGTNLVSSPFVLHIPVSGEIPVRLQPTTAHGSSSSLGFRPSSLRLHPMKTVRTLHGFGKARDATFANRIFVSFGRPRCYLVIALLLL